MTLFPHPKPIRLSVFLNIQQPILTMNTLAIPVITLLTIPDSASIESMKEGLPMSDHCRENLTTANFGMGTSPCKKMLCGFLFLPGRFSSEAGVKAADELARLSGCKFRLGTPLEALAYKKSGATYPKQWVVLSKKDSGSVLTWSVWLGDPRFSLRSWRGVWDSDCGVFVVKEPEG